MLGGGSWPRTPPETRGQTLRALDFTPHFAAFSRGKSSFGATLALRLVRFSKILDFQPRFHNFGGKIGSLAAIPSPQTAGGCPPHARGGGPTPPEASPHAGGGVPTPPEASPHARGGVGRGEKGAPLPGSDVRLLRSSHHATHVGRRTSRTCICTLRTSLCTLGLCGHTSST